MTRKTQTKTTAGQIDLAYIKTMEAAALLHRPVAPLSRRLADVLGALAAMEIRLPNDWEFQYSGCIELRWYDGPGDRLGSSTRSVCVVLTEDRAAIRGNVNSKRRYNSESGFNIEGINIEDALQMLKMLVKMVGNPEEKSDGA